MTRRAIHTASTLCAISGVLCGCMLSIDFDGYGTTATAFAVRGNVAGLEGERVRLRLEDTEIETGDGEFAFPNRLRAGQSFAVTIASPPAKHTCAMEAAEGIVARADVTTVRVECKSNDATLSSLVTSGELSPTFDPSVTDYHVAVTGSWLSALVDPYLSATPAHPNARLRIAGHDASPARPSREFLLEVGANVVEIEVTAPDGITPKIYRVSFDVAPVTRQRIPAHSEEETGFGEHLVIANGVLFATHEYRSERQIYMRVGSEGWHVKNTLISTSRTDPSFGDAMAVGDRNIIVGAPRGSASGSVYAGQGSGFEWNFWEGAIPFNKVSARFGSSVAVSAERLDTAQGVLVPLFVVGAPGEQSNATGIDGDPNDTSMEDAGAAFLCSYLGSTAAYLKPSNTHAGLQFGYAVATDFPDYRVAVSAYGDASDATGVDGDQHNDRAPEAGAVFLFRRDGFAWGQEAYLKASNTHAQAHFGAVVAFSRGILAVSAPDDPTSGRGVDPAANDVAAPHSGAVYIFERINGAWAQTAFVKSPGNIANGAFGRALSWAGSVLVIGAPGEADIGAVYLVARAPSGWQVVGRLSGPNRGSRFGSAVSAEGSTLVVGAPGESAPPEVEPAGDVPGGAYVY